MTKCKYSLYVLCLVVLILVLLYTSRSTNRKRAVWLARPQPTTGFAVNASTGLFSSTSERSFNGSIDINVSEILAANTSGGSTPSSVVNVSGSSSIKASQKHSQVNLGSDVVPLAAYFDGRRIQSHKTAIIILVSLLEKLVGNITGCVVDGTIKHKNLVRPIAVTWWIKDTHPVSHTDVFLWCYDMKVTSASNVSVLFNSLGSLVQVPVRRKGVVMPGKGPERDEVMVCVTGYGSPDYLDQWLLYQQKIGVKFIHMNVDVSFVQNVNKSTVLRELIKSNYVKMEEWKPYLNKSQVFLYSQSFKYQDCILRYQNIYKYMMIIDFDEYFVPLRTQKNVHYYAQRFLRGRIASVMLPSVRYYCKVSGFSTASLPKDGNMTTMFDTSFSTPQEDGKSIQIVKLILETSVHRPAYIMSRYRGAAVSRRRRICYISHITKYPSFTKKCKR